MKYKIGDKVKIISPIFPTHIGHIGTIIEAHHSNGDFPYRVQDDNNSGWTCLMYEKEIDALSKVNDQLLFPFMSDL